MFFSPVHGHISNSCHKITVSIPAYASIDLSESLLFTSSSSYLTAIITSSILLTVFPNSHFRFLFPFKYNTPHSSFSHIPRPSYVYKGCSVDWFTCTDVSEGPAASSVRIYTLWWWESFHWNIGTLLPDYTVSHLRTQQSIWLLP
jgi:hypothetical protein